MLLSLSISLSFSLGVAGLASSGAVFYTSSQVFLASPNTGTIIASLGIPNITAATLSDDTLFVASGNSISSYKVESGSFKELTSIEFNSSVDYARAYKDNLYVIMSGDEGKSTFLHYKFLTTFTQTKFSLVSSNVFNESFNGIYLSPNYAFLSSLNITYSYKSSFYTGIVKNTVLILDPLETSKGFIIATNGGELKHISYDGDFLSSIRLDSPADLLFYGKDNVVVVLSSRGTLYKISMPSFTITSTERGRDMGALSSSYEGSRAYVAYDNAVVYVGDSLRARYKLPYAVSGVLPTSTGFVALGFNKAFPKATPVKSNAGCYITSYPTAVGYRKFTITGKRWPPLNGLVTLKSPSGTLSIEANKEGLFNATLDPKGFDFGTLTISCYVSSSREDSITIERREDMPKDVFSIDGMPEKLKKGERASVDVKDSSGEPVEGFSLYIDGKRSYIEGSSFTLSFNDEGSHNIRLVKDGFDDYNAVVTVPSFPIVLVAIAAILILAVAIYFIMSRLS
ncbi:MAG: hypothetical protein D6769_01025 [Methanobacteriota archaeon]|nr:MAG: hypothetical protein D6769_01025 [Euryarchaeota archaeon]